jgi:hypothetical protein
MITAHLTETEVQLYVAEPDALGHQQLAHVAGCPLCRAKAANYTQLFNSMQHLPKPAFDFDLAALVMEQLPAPKRAFPWAAIMIAALAAGVVAVAAVCFGEAMAATLNAVPGVLLAVATTGALMILMFGIVEMFKEHQKRIDAIVSQKIMQL